MANSTESTLMQKAREPGSQRASQSGQKASRSGQRASQSDQKVSGRGEMLSGRCKILSGIQAPFCISDWNYDKVVLTRNSHDAYSSVRREHDKIVKLEKLFTIDMTKRSPNDRHEHNAYDI